jgi:pimeloyl-ACP methyl ester carboxylesterase
LKISNHRDMIEDAKKTIILSVACLLLLLNTQFFPAVNAQSEKLPVLLIHGYFSNASVWQTWGQLLRNDGVTARAVTFADNPTTSIDEDACGSAVAHANELNQIIENFKRDTGSEKINIVAHSKGGLDARVYLANNLSDDDVANLIMIGTPNKGSLLADRFGSTDACKPAIFDFTTNSPILNVQKNSHTKYHTIAGDWLSFWVPVPIFFPPGFTFIDINCPVSAWTPLEYTGRFEIIGSDDGIVPIASVESEGFIPLGRTDNCHTNLFGEEEYDMAREILT